MWIPLTPVLATLCVSGGLSNRFLNVTTGTSQSEQENQNYLRSSTCPLTGFFWLLSHVIYLKLTKVLYEFLLSQAEWWVAELLFLSLNNWGLNFLQNECSQSSQIYLSPEKMRKMFNFQSCKFFNDNIDQNINFAKLPSAK